MAITNADIIDAGGVRKLENAALQASLDRVLASLPDDHIAATVDVGIDAKGIQAVGAVKLSKGWSVTGLYDRRFAGPWSGHVQVRWSGR